MVGPVTFVISTVVTGVVYWAIMLSQLQVAQEVFPLPRYSQLSAASLIVQSLALAAIITPATGFIFDALKGVNLVFTVPLFGEIKTGPYRAVNLLLALIYALSWKCLRKVKSAEMNSV